VTNEMTQSIIEGIVEFIFQVIINILLITTGEVIIAICTFGARPFPWNIEKEPILKSMIVFELSFWIGLFFWIFLIGTIARLVG
jgi:hypothetical protein